MKARARAIITPHMTEFAASDECLEEAQVFVSPLEGQSTEVDAEAFVTRSHSVQKISAKPVIIEAKSGGNKRSAFAEVSGLYL